MSTRGDLRFDGQTALVTGAGGGLGREYALLLSQRGAYVIVNDAARERAEGVVEQIRRAGGSAHASTVTIVEPEACEAMVADAVARTGGIQVVINNAGNLNDMSFARMSLEDFRVVTQVHLDGTFNVIKAAWPHFRDSGYGRVLNTSSNSGILGNFGQANYGAAKAAVLGLTRVLAIEGRKHGVKVNAIAPYARTPMTAGLMASDLAEALDPALVAPVALWLVHRDCNASGDLFSAGGGRVSRYVQILTKGIVDPNLTPESVRDQWEAIVSVDEFSAPSHSSDVMSELLERRGSALHREGAA